LLVVPIWRESVDARFVLHPEQATVVRNVVPGIITDVLAEEGQPVTAGAPLLRLRNSPLESRVAEGEAKLKVATVRVRQASERHANLGTAMEEREQYAKQGKELESQESSLQIYSPIAGKVLTPRMGDQLGAYVPAGTALVEVADLHRMRARVYVSDYDMFKVRVGAPVRLSVESIPKLWTARTLAITPISTTIDPEIAEETKYKGLNAMNFYVVDLSLGNPDEQLKPGMIGVARIYGERRNLLSHMGREIARFFGGKVW
jgi:multidrug efflux pump subunit AcrA (membrane-fusion protein)